MSLQKNEKHRVSLRKKRSVHEVDTQLAASALAAAATPGGVAVGDCGSRVVFAFLARWREPDLEWIPFFS